MENKKLNSDGQNPKSKEEELWYDICGSIEEWQKLTKRNFIREYDEGQLDGRIRSFIFMIKIYNKNNVENIKIHTIPNPTPL